MELFSLILVLVLYFLRPQEWGLGGLHPIEMVSALVFVSILTKKGGFHIKDLFRTPHHWFVFAYFAWTVIASPAHLETFKSIQANMLFYVIAVLALTNISRLKTFMTWWVLLIMVVTILALVSEIGIDPLGSHDITEGPMRGRLTLNLSIFNNPNALAHSVIPVLPMLYFLYFWKRTIGKISLVILLLPMWCIYLTLSKGAFLCGFATLATILTFGRPKIMQILILALCATVGVSALYSLPRMDELKKTSNDQAIQGRVAAANFGMECMQRSWWGNGYGRFVEEFFEKGPLERDIPHAPMHHYYKAAHDAYVQNGADLGFPGLFLFVGILYCCLRTLVTAKTRDIEEERIRRILFSLVISYAVSCWMVDFFYRTILFLFAAATAAFHLILSQPKGAIVEAREPEPGLPWRKQLQRAIAPAIGIVQPIAVSSSASMMNLPAASTALTPVIGSPDYSPTWISNRDNAEASSSTAATMKWKHIGVIDLLLNWLLTFLVIRYWAYIIQTM